MANKKTLAEAVSRLSENNLPVSELTKISVSRLENPHYRIGFVGQYQVGKSTLINRVFLRDDLLLKEGSADRFCFFKSLNHVRDRKSMFLKEDIKIVMVA